MYYNTFGWEMIFMASANWQKHSGGTSVKAQFRHCDKNERLKVKHANEEIDANLTYKNLSFGIFQGDYKSACHAYDERIEYIDKHAGLKKKPRKDRVTCVSWSIPQPEGMSEDMASKWFTDVYALLTREYSEVLGASVHFDEVHEYVDASTGETTKSRPHMHAFVLPVVEKDGFRRLIGKDFSKRDKMIQLNNSIQKLTEDKYPGYTFMTGVKHPGKYQSVEDSKRQSKIMKALQDDFDVYKSNALQVIEQERAKFKAEVAVANKKLAEREQAVAVRESNAKAKEEQTDAYVINVKDIEKSTDVSEHAFANWKYVNKEGKIVDFSHWFEKFVKEQNKAANAKKQKAKPSLAAPKPVDYAQKALGVIGEQLVNKAVQAASESIKRKTLSTPPSLHEDESDEWSL